MTISLESLRQWEYCCHSGWQGARRFPGMEHISKLVQKFGNSVIPGQRSQKVTKEAQEMRILPIKADQSIQPARGRKLHVVQAGMLKTEKRFRLAFVEQTIACLPDRGWFC